MTASEAIGVQGTLGEKTPEMAIAQRHSSIQLGSDFPSTLKGPFYPHTDVSGFLPTV